MKKRMKVVFYTALFCILSLTVYTASIAFGRFDGQIEAVAGSRTKTVDLYSLRGTVYDMDFRPITNGRALYYLLIDPRSFDKTQTSYICEICETDAASFEAKLEKESVFILSSSEKPKETAGVHIFSGVERYQNIAAHLIGYTDSDGTGVAGLEKCYDKELSYFGGTKSITYTSDAVRNPIFGLGITVDGKNGNYKDGLVTTLDINLQKALESAMDKHIQKGAAVVLDASSGEVRAMMSLPDFEPDSVAEYLNAGDGQLINRCLSRQTVGSVFKIVLAAAALEQGLEQFTYECGGSISISDRSFSCSGQTAHGKMDLETAFCKSCNAYFIALGQLLGFEKIIETAERLGFSESIEIARGLYGAAGSLPSGTGEVAKELANFSIGQGDVMASPLQIARLLAVCCNGGYLVKPTVVKGFYVSGKMTGESWLTYRNRVLEADVAEKLRGFCVEAVRQGTGKAAQPEGGSAGGKTASAQTGMFDSSGKEILNTYFAGFYPAENPQYAIAVFAENGTSGGATCAPVFKEVCEYLQNSRGQNEASKKD